MITAGAGGIVGFLFALFVLSQPTDAYWPATMSGPYVEVTFTVMLAAMSSIVFLSLRARDRGTDLIEGWNGRITVGLFGAGIVGGIASASTRQERSARSAVGPYPARQYLYGLWLAAVPVIVWGALLGAHVAHTMTERPLITFVATMAGLEVLSTVIFLDELHSSLALAVYGALVILGAIAVIRWMSLNRTRLLSLDAQDPPPRVAALVDSADGDPAQSVDEA